MGKKRSAKHSHCQSNTELSNWQTAGQVASIQHAGRCSCLFDCHVVGDSSGGNCMSLTLPTQWQEGAVGLLDSLYAGGAGMCTAHVEVGGTVMLGHGWPDQRVTTALKCQSDLGFCGRNNSRSERFSPKEGSRSEPGQEAKGSNRE